MQDCTSHYGYSSSSSSNSHASQIVTKREVRLAMIGGELSGKYEGPMDPMEFLDKFLPPNLTGSASPVFNDDIKKQLEGACTRKGRKGREAAAQDGVDDRSHTEDKMYDPLIKAIVSSLSNLDLKLKLCNTSRHDTTVSWCHGTSHVSPDIPVYDVSNLPNAGVKVDMSKVEVFIECKTTETQSGFTSAKNHKEKPTALERDSDQGKETRYQLAAYVGAIMASQFRTHCFAVEICADQARFLRYDHGGATVTSTFSVYQEPYLVEFFARYNQASPETRGHDPSVVRLKTGTSDDDRIKDTKEKLGLEDNDPVFKFTVKDEFDQKTHVFHGAKIIVKASSCPQGRSTRGFLVLDEKGNKRFLKDTWRVDLAELDTEGKVYRILHGIEDGPGTDTTVSDRKVPHIPTVIASGDVEGAHQKTTMKDLWGVKEGKQRQYQHYYLVLKEVGKALDQFEDQLEWISATADAIEAHQKACEIHQILHRDISVGNILIYEGRGLLIDWEFSKCMTIKHARQTERTGTWQFMSARLLRAKPGENVTHTIADDLESFFHVTCWIALKHTQHGLEDFEVISLLRGIFDAAEFMPGMTYGGDGKRCALRALRMKEEVEFHPGPTKDLILDLEQVFRVVYQRRPSDEDLERVKATLAAGKMIDGDNDTLTDAHRWRIRQAQLEHRWVFNRFTTVVEEFRALSSPAPKRVSRPRLAVLATIPFIPSGASKRSLNMLSRIESSQSSKRQRTN